MWTQTDPIKVLTCAKQNIIANEILSDRMRVEMSYVRDIFMRNRMVTDSDTVVTPSLKRYGGGF